MEPSSSLKEQLKSSLLHESLPNCLFIVDQNELPYVPGGFVCGPYLVLNDLPSCVEIISGGICLVYATLIQAL